MSSADRQRFLDCMEYRASDRRPNHELGVWAQTRLRWLAEAPQAVQGFGWNWFDGEDALGLDRREYIPVDYGFIPPYAAEVLEEDEHTLVARNAKGIVTRALKEGSVGGARMCMDEYIGFPVTRPGDFQDVRRRLIAALPQRYPPDLAARIAAWKARSSVLVLGRNCAANGFYWRAREFMGTEGLSLAWYD